MREEREEKAVFIWKVLGNERQEYAKERGAVTTREGGILN